MFWCLSYAKLYLIQGAAVNLPPDLLARIESLPGTRKSEAAAYYSVSSMGKIIAVYGTPSPFHLADTNYWMPIHPVIDDQLAELRCSDGPDGKTLKQEGGRVMSLVASSRESLPFDLDAVRSEGDARVALLEAARSLLEKAIAESDAKAATNYIRMPGFQREMIVEWVADAPDSEWMIVRAHSLARSLWIGFDPIYGVLRSLTVHGLQTRA